MTEVNEMTSRDNSSLKDSSLSLSVDNKNSSNKLSDKDQND